MFGDRRDFEPVPLLILSTLVTSRFDQPYSIFSYVYVLDKR